MKLMHIPLSKIIPNPDNPRGIDIQTENPKLADLKDSIRQFGVLVPVVVSKKGSKFLLIDGERRYWACKALNLDEVPAFIVDERGDLTDSEILYRMFQIHHNREQWLPIQQCHALEVVYRKVVKQAAIRSLADERASSTRLPRSWRTLRELRCEPLSAACTSSAGRRKSNSDSTIALRSKEVIGTFAKSKRRSSFPP